MALLETVWKHVSRTFCFPCPLIQSLHFWEPKEQSERTEHPHREEQLGAAAATLMSANVRRRESPGQSHRPAAQGTGECDAALTMRPPGRSRREDTRPVNTGVTETQTAVPGPRAAG